MGRIAGLVVYTGSAVGKADGLALHRWRQLKLSSDPAFAEQIIDGGPLHVSPPARALALSLNEKACIGAVDRTPAGPPPKKGRSATLTHDWKCNGTITPFARSMS